MANRKVGTWIYQNSGGDVIEQKIIAKLKEREIDTVTNLNLRDAYATNNEIICNNQVMEDLDAYFSYNAGEQTVYQMYLYEVLDRRIPILNNFKSFELTEDKFRTNKVLRDNGVATTDFFLCHRDHPEMIDEIFNQWDGKFVYKPVDGWGGVGMVLVESKNTLDIIKPFLNQSDIRFFYLEKFINYDGSDYRVDIVDGEFVACYGRRAKKGDWRTNVTSGGSVFLREANDELVEVAKKAASATGLEIAGVDIIYDRDKEEYIVLEVNGIPAFATPSQEELGLNFNDKKIDLIVDLIDRKTKK
jgi:ribosomal protein S6--L-glutamate ligase